MIDTDAAESPLVVGEVLYDRFPDGSEVLGGAPFNVAWHLRGFGVSPRVVTRIGMDARGDGVLTAMVRWKLDTRCVQRDREHPTGRVTVELNPDGPRFRIEPDQAYDRIQPPDPLPPAPALYHGTLVLRSPESARAVAALNRGGAPVFIDANLRAPWWERETVLRAVRDARWVKLSVEELGLLVGTPVEDERLDDAATDFREQSGIEMLIVTRGGEGSLAVDGAGRVTRQDAEPVGEIADTVGAGDAFAAVFLLGLLRGLSVTENLDRASRFAAEICRIPGATTEDRGLYARTLESWGDAPHG
jgi:fructokinase